MKETKLPETFELTAIPRKSKSVHGYLMPRHVKLVVWPVWTHLLCSEGQGCQQGSSWDKGVIGHETSVSGFEIRPQ